MAPTKKTAPTARPAKAAKAPSKKAAGAPKAAKKPAAKPKAAEKPSKAAAEKPSKKAIPAPRASSKAVAAARPSSKEVAKSSKDVDAAAKASSKDVSKAAKASSRDVAKSSRDVEKAAKAQVKIEAKMSEPDLGTYRTRPPPPLPKIAAQPIPAPAPPPPRPPMPPAKGYQPIVNIQPFPRSTEPLNLSVGDKAVHPLHGLGEVSSIEHREVGGVSGDFYVLRILDKGMRVMVPKASATSSGLRAVMSEKDANAVLDTLRAKEVAVDLQPWSRRFRAYTEMMKSGSPHEVAKVLRDMFRLKFDKDLSFGERRLLDQAKSLLMKELAAAKKISEADLLAEVSDMFKA